MVQHESAGCWKFAATRCVSSWAHGRCGRGDKAVGRRSRSEKSSFVASAWGSHVAQRRETKYESICSTCLERGASYAGSHGRYSSCTTEFQEQIVEDHVNSDVDRPLVVVSVFDVVLDAIVSEVFVRHLQAVQ